MSKPVEPSVADLPPDPLLDSRAFIDANDQGRSSEPIKPPNGSSTDGAQPEARSSSPALAKEKNRVVPPETWLPAGWSVENRVRTSGVTAGTVDKYYVDPSSGRKFRSKKEVLYFLENGTTPKRKKGIETPGNEESMGNSAGNKQKKSKQNPKPLNFDFTNVPEKVEWLLTNSSADSWTPFLGDVQVPESTRRDWGAAFTFLTTSKHGQPMF